MKKRIVKFLLVFLVAFLISFLSISDVSAADTYVNGERINFRNKLTVGRDIAYMIHQGCEYTISIPQGVQKLMYPTGMTNPLILTPTTDYMHSKMDFYQYFSNDGANAYVMVFRKNSSGYYYNSVSEMDSNDWVYGEIYINDYYMTEYDNNLRSTIILHEILHTYGLKDLYLWANRNSIMYGYTPNVRTMTIEANNILKQKY